MLLLLDHVRYCLMLIIVGILFAIYSCSFLFIYVVGINLVLKILIQIRQHVSACTVSTLVKSWNPSAVCAMPCMYLSLCNV